MLDRQGITGSIGKNWTGIGVTNQIGGLAERNKGEERGEGKRSRQNIPISWGGRGGGGPTMRKRHPRRGAGERV